MASQGRHFSSFLLYQFENYNSETTISALAEEQGCKKLCHFDAIIKYVSVFKLNCNL